MKLDGVKVGDTLAEVGRFGVGIRLWKVERVTATLAICGDGQQRFKLSTGGVPGSSGFSMRWVRIATADDKRQARIQVAQHRLSAIKVDATNLKVIESMLAELATPTSTTGD